MYSADLVRDRRFWKISVADDKTTIVSFGALGSKGRSSSRSFPSASEADEWARTAAAAKEADGYVAAAMAAAPRKMTTRAASKKRVKEQETVPLSATKKLRRCERARGAAKPFTVKEEEALGEVDSHANAKGSTVTLGNDVRDAMLADVGIKDNLVKAEHTITSVAPAPVRAVVVPKKGAAATKTTKTKKGAAATKASKVKKGTKKGGKKAAKTEPKAESESEITPAAPQQPAVTTVKPPVDAMFPNAHKAEVVDDYDATLNQTNITGGSNNNKYYRIQLLCVKNNSYSYVVWTRWGRVGESSNSSTLSIGPFMTLEKAIPVFEKKFFDKTGNKWENRSNFVPRTKKYDLLEVDYTKKEDAHVDAFAAFDATGGSAVVQTKADNVEYLASKLDTKTQDLVNMLFEKDLYSHAMQEFDIDTRRMPLGQLTAAQIQRGVDVLKDIEDILRTGCTWAPELDGLSSRFYSVIPHDFGRQRPPKINNMQMLQKCFDKCIVLLDIEKATKLMADAENRKKEEAKAKAEKVLVPNPVDGMYDSLGAGLTLVAPGSSEHSKVTRAFKDTSGGYRRAQLVDVWRVDRRGEDERFAPFRKLKNHKLLWHGTNIAVVAAILSSGLRIMPHSGGRCGAGIYLASESGKSQGYTRPNYKRNIGCMFLAEAALGKEFSLLEDDPSLRKAPNQCDSVVARGTQTPAAFEQVAFGSIKVLLPSAQPVQVPAHAKSSFSQDEYLVYREEQVRLRYVLTIRF